MSAHSLNTLTHGFAVTCKPETMTLADIDRLHSTICCVLIEQPQHLNPTTLEHLTQLATNLNQHRHARRLDNTGQLDIHGNELAA